MSKRISINLDEGPIEVNDALKCESLLKRITVCKNCGRIHFLDPDETDPCAKHKRQTLEAVLDSKRKSEKRYLIQLQTRSLFITLICFVVVAFLNEISIDHSIIGIHMAAYYVIKICFAILAVTLVVQIVLYIQSVRIKTETDSTAAFLIRNYTPEKAEYQGQTWENAIQMAYAHEIGHLETWARTLAASKSNNTDAWEVLYTSAMELSYCCDCTQLALLRLACLERITFLPQTYTDIRQIIRILPDKILANWLETVVVCLEHLCIPCDDITAHRFASLAIYCLDSSTVLQKDQKNDVIQLLVRGFSAIGPYHMLRICATDNYMMLQDIIRRTSEIDGVYAAALQPV